MFIHTFAAKLGASIAAPLALLGAHGFQTPQATAHADMHVTIPSKSNTAHSSGFAGFWGNSDKSNDRSNYNGNKDYGNKDWNNGKHGTTTPPMQSSKLAITSIDAPATLDVNEEGTWTVNAKSKGDDSLSYSVIWGDEGAQPMALRAAAVHSSASFTHTYADAGTYTPVFTVHDSSGKSVSLAAHAVTVSEAGIVHLDSLSATTGHSGASVTITGSGIASDATVYFGGTAVATSTVNSDSSVTFTIPSDDVGTYDVTVMSNGATSNALSFELTATPDRVSISGVDAPVQLAVGEEGTWTVNADTNASGLHYSVDWGDEGFFRTLLSAILPSTVQASSTFTHTYDDAGTYHPKFTVTDDSGHKSSVSASVVVSG